MRLPLYVGRVVLRMLLLVGIALTALFSLLELVEQLRSIGQGHYGLLDALEYVAMTAPSRLFQLTPVATLLGILLALGAMAGSSELTAIRAAGVSQRRVLAWVLCLALAIIAVLIPIAEWVVPPAQRSAQIQRAAKIEPTEAMRSANGFWARGDHQFLNVRQFRESVIPESIEIYVFNGDGALEQLTYAERGEIGADGRWTLRNAITKRFIDARIETQLEPVRIWDSFLRPGQTRLLTLPPESMAPSELYRYVVDLKRLHQQAARYEQALWTLLAVPAATLAMVLIAAPLIFGSLRLHSAGQRVAIGAIIGIAFSLAQQISTYSSLLLNLNPAVTALAPSLLLALLAWGLLRARPL